MNENIVEELQQIEFDGDLEQILGADLMARLFAALAQQPASEPVGYTYTESLQDLKSCPSGTAFMLPVTDDAEGDMSEPVFIGPQPTPQVPDEKVYNAIREAGDHLRRVMGEYPYCDHVQVVKNYADIRRRLDQQNANSAPPAGGE